MGKLHELLAVEGDLKGKAAHALAEVRGLFTSGQAKFIGQVRKYRPLDDEGERLPDETTNLATAVDNELQRLAGQVVPWLDAVIQKEVTNQSTKADVTIDGSVILSGLPATALLNLEARLAELRQVYAAIPINDPGEKWTLDPALGHYVSDTRETRRAKKVVKVLVKYEATKEHPAQTETYSEDIPVGVWATTIHSGQLSMVEKFERLERLDNLLKAVKEARQRANNVEVVSVAVGKTIFDYVNGF